MEDKLHWESLENKGWSDMEHLLDEQMPTSNANLAFYWGVAIFLIASLGLFAYLNIKAELKVNTIDTNQFAEIQDDNFADDATIVQVQIKKNSFYRNSNNTWSQGVLALQSEWSNASYDVFKPDWDLPNTYVDKQLVAYDIALGDAYSAMASLNRKGLNQDYQISSLEFSDEEQLQRPDINFPKLSPISLRAGLHTSSNFRNMFQSQVEGGIQYEFNNKLSGYSLLSLGHGYFNNATDFENGDLNDVLPRVDNAEYAFWSTSDYLANTKDQLKATFHQYQLGVQQGLEYELFNDFLVGGFLGLTYIQHTKSYNDLNVYLQIVENLNRTEIVQERLSRNVFSDFTPSWYVNYGLSARYELTPVWSIGLQALWERDLENLDYINISSKRHFRLGLGIIATI